MTEQEYDFSVMDEYGGKVNISVRAESLDDAVSEVEELIADWCRRGCQGDDAGLIQCHYWINIDGEEVDEGNVLVEVSGSIPTVH